ncbi:MAG TPA: HAMP domain-containing sensor histidine kinase [Vicinamibacterales bacterium]|nr:HAMP domain-containing sensor histidine kinase [Vicinamibacterales bacterium]
MRLTHPLWRARPLVLAIVATIGAAALVMYFQYRAIAALQLQTHVIVRQISEQAATEIANEMHRALAGPVLDTLTAVSQPDLRAGRFDLVAQQFKKGLEAYPHVDRFLAWSAGTDAETPGEVLFFGRDGRFERDPALGKAVFELAKRHASAQHIYIAAEDVGPGKRHQVLLRVFWNDAKRLEYFAVLGMVVDPKTMPARLFAEPRRARINALLAGRRDDLPLQLRVIDHRGSLIYESATGDSAISSRLTFPMLFYPAEEIQSRMSGGAATRSWQIEVGAPAIAMAGVGQSYWPTLLSAALMLVALGLTVQAHRRSAELAEMQTDFVAHVSHQLKTPLSLLSAATETLQMDRVRSPEKFGEYLDTIRTEAARLSMLVQRVLEFSRVQQASNYELEHVDFGALTRETVDAFAHGLAGQHFTFNVHIDGPGPYVHVDPAALEQALANLLDNAVKYSDAIKEITVRVHSDRHCAMVDISDRGLGVAGPDQQRIFDRFYRAPSALHRPGFGLGLPIVRDLVEAHGGRVDMTSVRGAGSTFRISLPRVHSPAPVASRPVESPEAAS